MKTIAEVFRSYAVFNAEGHHTNGTDKQSNHHYGDAYERILTYDSPQDDPGDCVRAEYPHSIRLDVKLMMEIGVADGSSLLAWRDIFPNALCVGMDIHPAARLDEPCHSPQRPIEFYLGDQRSKEDCERAAAGRQFDLIVEDATHSLANTLLTLFYMWPHVKPGGLYIVEEWDGIGGAYHNVRLLWPNAEIVETIGPSGGCEPLVVFRKPMGTVWK